MYQNYIFDLYGTLVDIRTDEWQAQLWKKMQLLYNYHGADYSYQEIKRAYVRRQEREKKKVILCDPARKVAKACLGS